LSGGSAWADRHAATRDNGNTNQTHTSVFRTGIISHGAVEDRRDLKPRSDLYSSKQSYLHTNISSIGTIGNGGKRVWR